MGPSLGACAPKLVVSSLVALNKAPNNLMIASNPPVMWLQSPSLWTGPSVISNFDPPVSLLVASVKSLNSLRVSNEATGSSMRPNGHNPYFSIRLSAFLLQRTIYLAPKDFSREGGRWQ